MQSLFYLLVFSISSILFNKSLTLNEGVFVFPIRQYVSEIRTANADVLCWTTFPEKVWVVGDGADTLSEYIGKFTKIYVDSKLIPTRIVSWQPAFALYKVDDAGRYLGSYGAPL